MLKSLEKRSHSQTRLKYLQKIGFKHEVKKLRKDYNNSNRFNQLKHQERVKSLRNLQREGREGDTEEKDKDREWDRDRDRDQGRDRGNGSKGKDRDRKNVNIGNFLDPTKIISVSANKWVIMSYFNSTYVRGYRAHDQCQLSIFSKLLVFCTINTLIIRNKIDTSRFQVIVTPTITKFYKNTQLKPDDVLTLQDLIHLMLMDQGEQYQLIAAINIGAYLQKKRKKQYYSVYDAEQKMFKTHMSQFYELVNSYCQTMKLQTIHYIQSNPSLRRQNKCTPADIATLSIQCLKIPLFRSILALNQKSIQIKYISQDGNLQVRPMVLRNKTINNKYIGYFSVARNWEENQFMNSHGAVYYEQVGIEPIVVVLVGAYGPNDRERDIQQIIQWYLKSLGEKDKKNKDKEKEKKGVNKQEQVLDPETVSLAPNDLKKIQNISNRFKTQQTQQLDIILEQKLKGSDVKNFQIRQRKSTKRIITQH